MEGERSGEAASRAGEGAARFPVRAALSFAILVFLLPFVLFLAAGRLDWSAAWVYLILHVSLTLLSRVLVWRAHPELLAERGRSVDERLAQGWDRLLLPLTAVVGPLVTWVIAGLDERLAWSPGLPAGVQALAGVVLAGGYLLGAWAMAANAYFSAVVRIQADRGQQVVAGGPYRLVRHPGYAGGVLAYLAMPILLDSLWALLPVLLTVGGVVLRTAMEDRVLHAELPGYVEYARRSRYRLLPGVW